MVKGGNNKKRGADKGRKTKLADFFAEEDASAAASRAKNEELDSKPICIRCPTRREADGKHHENDFEKCYQDYPTRHSDNNAASKPLITAQELWWDFSRMEPGIMTDDFDLLSSFKLDSADKCERLLENAKGVGKKNFPSKGDDSKKKDKKEQALQRNKQEATCEIPTNGPYAKPVFKLITKEILEAALRAVRSVTSIEKAEKSMKDVGVVPKKRSHWDTALALMKMEDEASI
jgi:hypothetical protein